MYDLITILGPTAGGKTAIAARLAYELGGEVISADSRQLYRRMDIGTGKDLADYVVNGHQVPYHLVDIIDAGTRYNVFEYQRVFLEAYNDVRARGKQPVLCGGSGLYIEAVVNGYDLAPVPPNESLRAELETKTYQELHTLLASLKKMHNTTDVDTRKRTIRAIEIAVYYQEHPRETRVYPNIKNIYFGIQNERAEQRQRIAARLHARLAEGMVDEVRNLMAHGLTEDDMLFYGLEYKFITLYLTGKLTYNEMTEQLYIAICQFAKRQMTWFRGMERKGAIIHWIPGEWSIEEKLAEVKRILAISS